MSLTHPFASSATQAPNLPSLPPNQNPGIVNSAPASANLPSNPNAPINPNNPNNPNNLSPDQAANTEPEPLPWWHDWDIDGPTATKTFHSFSLLPLELQDTIWSLALSPFFYPSALQRSQFFSLSSYASDPFVGQVDSYKPLIQSPPAWKWYSKAEYEEMQQRREEGRRRDWHLGEEGYDKHVVIYAKPNRAAKWKVFFYFMWACKGSRKVALEAWRAGVKGKVARDVYDGFTQRDVLKVLDSCLVRVSRKGGYVAMTR